MIGIIKAKILTRHNTTRFETIT